MREADKRAQRGGGGEVHQVVADAVAARQFSFAQQPDFGREPSGVAPVVRGRDADGTEAGPPRGIRAIAPRDESPLTRRLRCRPCARLHGVGVGRQTTARSRTAFAGQRRRRLECGCPQEHFEIGRDPQRVGQLGAMQRAAQRGVVAELGIADDGGDREPGRAHLAQQRQGQLPFRREPHGRGNLGPRPLARRQPFLGQIQRRAQQPRPGPRPQRHGDGRLAIGDLAARTAVPSGDPHGGQALFGKTRPVENQHARALRDARAQPCPDVSRRPTAHA